MPGRTSAALLRGPLPATLMFLGAEALSAQTASLSGVVTDASGAVIPNAQVTATQVNRNLKFEAVTDELGRYLLQNLPIGPYTVQAQAGGFRQFTQTGLELTVDMRGLLNITVQVGEVSERVEVMGQVSRVDVEAATIQQLVDSRRVVDLPLNGRNAYQLARLAPGTGSSGFNINGGRAGRRSTSANVRLDGAMNVDQNLFTVLPSPPPDAVQESNIQTSVPSAKYGFSSGVIEVVTKSGTNDLHGALYDFLRNDKMDARSFFSATKTRRRRNQYGAALGGRYGCRASTTATTGPSGSSTSSSRKNPWER